MPLFSRILRRHMAAIRTGGIHFEKVLKETARDDRQYQLWIDNYRWTARNEEWCRKQVDRFQYRPRVGILMQSKDPEETLFRESLGSIFNQVYPFDELSIVDRGSKKPEILSLLEHVEKDSRVKVSYQKGAERDVEAIARIMKKAEAEWLLLVRAEDILEPNTLYNMVGVLQNTVEIDFVFSDSDMIDDQGLRFDPQFKPVWAVGSYYRLGYYEHPMLLSRRLVDKLKGFERVSALMEEGTLLDEGSNHSRYVLQAPGILYHGRARGLANEKPPAPVNNVLMSERLKVERDRIVIDVEQRVRAEPRVPLRILWMIDSLDRDDGPIFFYHFVRYLSQSAGHSFSVVSSQDGPLQSLYEESNAVTIASNERIGSVVAQIHNAGPFDVAVVASVHQDRFDTALTSLNIPFLWYFRPGGIPEQLESQMQFPGTIVFGNPAVLSAVHSIDKQRIARFLPAAVDHIHAKVWKQRNSPFDWRNKFGIPLSAKVFVIAGPTVERKGQTLFVDAALKLMAKKPDAEVIFVIAGDRPGPYSSEIQTKINASPFQNKFLIFPETNDVFQYYPHYLIADAVVSCSKEEPYPLALLEAMAMKKAVLGPQIPAIDQIIEQDENGYFFDGNDSTQLSERMEFLVSKPEVFDFLGRRSLEIIYEKFQLKRVAARFEDFLRETIVYSPFSGPQR